MARKRTDQNTESAEQKQDRRRLPKLIVTLGTDGKPDLSSINEEARERLRAALDETAPEPPEPVEPAVVASLWLRWRASRRPLWLPGSA